MLSKWSDEDARAYCQTFAKEGEDLALRVYTTRLLGREPTLVLHGGGNTSVKTEMNDSLGRPVPVLCVKGSGWDMGEIEPPGLPAVRLEPLRELVALEALSDEDMVNNARRNLMDASSPNPSVETLLHAFLPHKYIDHTHADAVLALANQPKADELSRQIWGDKMGIVPYIMPGFALAKKALEVYQENPAVEGLILINHGIFTFADSAREAYERMIEHVSRAEQWFADHAKVQVPSWGPIALDDSAPEVACLPTLRGCLINHEEGIGHVVLHRRDSQQIRAFIEHERVQDIATRGPITPDHVIRTKQKPMFLDADLQQDVFREQVNSRLAEYVANYKKYFATCRDRKGVVRKMVHPLPVVFLIKGLGLVTMGTSMKAARIAADLYEHTIDTILKAESVGSYQPLDDDHLFDMEYWSLEQAKLGKKKPAPMEGHLTVITGAGGGIGAATAAQFASQGSNLVLTDLDGEALEKLTLQLSKQYGIAVTWKVADVTDRAAVEAVVNHAVSRYGGLDVVVSNAGTAPNQPIHLATDLLARSIQINLMSHQYISAAATHTMLTQKSGGCLLYNASKSAFNPGPGFGPYSIPKAGVIALMKQYAVEYAGHGIRCNAINADRIRTGLFDEELVAARARARGLEPDAYFRANLMGCEVYAEDVARAFYHLWSSAKTTAAIMTVDGGNIAASPR